MRNLNQSILKITAALFFCFAYISGIAQGAAAAPKANTDAANTAFVFDVNTVLALLAILLFLILGVLAITLRSSMELYKNKVEKEKEHTGNGGKIVAVMIGLLLICSATAIAQTAAPAASEPVFSDNKLLRYLLLFIIFLELAAIFAVIKWLRFFTGIEDMNVAKGKKGIMGWSFSKWWGQFNKIKPIESEASIDMGHSYDGIRELDNVLPPWFTWTFIATIVFGMGYLWRYHAAANPAPNQYEEYESSVAAAKVKMEAYLKSKGDQVDETNVKMLGPTDIATGKTLFASNCVVCHGDKGQGGVGPNLTDAYWIHGGKIGDVFKVIKFGVVEKGMQSWKDVFSATQIAQLASYIESLKGTNPPGAKAPQGDLFKDDGGAVPADSATAKKSGTATAAHPDSAAAK